MTTPISNWSTLTKICTATAAIRNHTGMKRSPARGVMTAIALTMCTGEISGASVASATIRNHSVKCESTNEHIRFNTESVMKLSESSLGKGLISLVAGVCLIGFIAVFVSLNLSDRNVMSANAQEFNHDDTSFPLDLAHRRTACDSCHLQGIFTGTPTECQECHHPGARIQASAPSASHIRTTQDCVFCHQASQWENVVRVDHFAVIGTCQSCHNGSIAMSKDANHISSSEQCDDCHRTNTWSNAVFDHGNIKQPCQSCHNGIIATGKDGRHINSSQQCDLCHRSISWDPVLRVDHNAVFGSCKSCHNGVNAEGKHSSHIATNASCDNCHGTVSWTVGVFNHSNVTGNCQSCHNGNAATGKNPDHISSTNECAACHTTAGWTPVVRVDHAAVKGSCSSCHNGQAAEGKPNNHFITNQQCDYCHITSNWASIIFDHQSPNYPGDHRVNLGCLDCHASNSEAVSWTSGLQPTCAGCHQADYVQRKHEGPNNNFESVSQNADCSGSCHQKSSHHRITDRQWNR